MTQHRTGTRDEWLAARLELLAAEKALTRQSDELARRRQELPWVRVDKPYRFDTDGGAASPARRCAASAPSRTRAVRAARRATLRASPSGASSSFVSPS